MHDFTSASILLRMSSENLELLREALRGRSGADSFYAVLDPDVEWDVSRAPGDTQVIRGRDAVRGFMPTWRHGWEYWRFAEEDFRATGEQVVTVARDPAGSEDRAALWSFREGKVVRFVWYEWSSEALADAGLPPSA
jgi:ketosteroid isomerase-like protein